MIEALARMFVSAIVTIAFIGSAFSADRKDDDKKLSGNDRHFITRAAEDGLAEIELGKLAQQKASSAEVKQFGQRMAEDHAKAQQELAALAAKLGAAVPAQPGNQHAGDMNKLARLDGARFDQDYSDKMVKDHEKAIALFEKQASKGDREELKHFAAKLLPLLQEHLKMARSLTAQKK
jgi:putative membrane protein